MSGREGKWYLPLPVSWVHIVLLLLFHLVVATVNFLNMYGVKRYLWNPYSDSRAFKFLGNITRLRGNCSIPHNPQIRHQEGNCGRIIGFLTDSSQRTQQLLEVLFSLDGFAIYEALKQIHSMYHITRK